MFQDVGDLPGGPFKSWTRGVSANGEIVVGHSLSGTIPEGVGEGFRWSVTDGLSDLGTNDLPPPIDGFVATIALDATRDGSVVVGRKDLNFGLGIPATFEPFIWDQENGFQQIEFRGLPATFTPTVLIAVSSDGTAAAGNANVRLSSETIGIGAFYWTEDGSATALGSLGNGKNQSRVLSMSDDGQTIVGSSLGLDEENQFVQEAFIWNLESGMTGLGDLPGGLFDSMAWDVSNDGSIARRSNSRRPRNGGIQVERRDGDDSSRRYPGRCIWQHSPSCIL